ncbi:MAG: DUF1848 domain-containing protein [Treponema sp.]|nr:DUF1848 domain-containing protein [Treponema sp.]
MIVSVSRRCDIPRLNFKWFMERLDAGFVDAVNPFNANQIRRVPLVPAGTEQPDGVEAFVFWTRNPRHILANAEELEKRGFNFYVMVTVTGYPLELEPSMAKPHKVIASMKNLASKIGSDRVIWRYDPIFISSITNEEFHRKNFGELAQELSGSVRRVIVSLYNEYRGSKQRIEGLERAGVLQMGQHDAAGLGDLLSDLAESARAANMEIQSCAEEKSFEPYGIRSGACIDAELINRLWGLDVKGKDKNQRPNCLCCQSVDIGSYKMCNSGCVYCYAW